MAVVCFGPPPLPPNKKSLLLSTGSASQIRHRKHVAPSLGLSSTYMSFTDSYDDYFAPVMRTAGINASGGRICHSNSLRRSMRGGNVRIEGPKLSLIRSQSEGNLSTVDKKLSTFDKCVKALSGSWKNLLQLGGMSRAPKPAATAKKVAPPAVPHEFRHSGSSFGSAGYASSEDAVFLVVAPGGAGTTGGEAPGIPRDDHSDYGSTISSAGKSPGPMYPQTTFTFPGQAPPPPVGTVLSHKTAVYLHHQLSLQEDQGIDMTQSPGRDSPGSSSGSAGSGSRHSTASLDSGRASYHPLSQGTRSTGSTLGSSNSPRCSLSSCSIGSDGTSVQARVERLLHQGAPDHDVMHAWLADLHFEEYFPLFVAAGYDMPTIGKMTPEDLTAIGIKKPDHRKKLKAEIAQLNLPDNLPEYIPGSLEEWLRLLRLEYLPHLLAQGYQTVDDVTQLTWEDLEDIGIVKLGHQKKIILAIKRVKDIRGGKRFPVLHTIQQDVSIHAPLGPPSPGCPQVHSTFRSFHQPWELDQTRQLNANANSNQQTFYEPIFCTDIIPIKIRGNRGKSLESLEDANEHTHHTFNAENTQTFYYHQSSGGGSGGGWRPRSYDDGDITPTNETSTTTASYEGGGGGGTLPRPRGLVRPRPVAKITANNRDYPPQFKTLPRDYIQFSSPQLGGKKLPPSPPKRQDSDASNSDAPQSIQCQTTVEIHHHHHNSSPLPLPAYPSSDSLSITLDGSGDLPLPPPPAPQTPPQVRMNPSRSWAGNNEEQELINALALQHRNGSDASFKSSSSTESDSLPFANENAGTIKTRTGGGGGGGGATNTNNTSGGGGGGRTTDYPIKTRGGLLSSPPTTQQQQQQQVVNQSNQQNQRTEPADVLNDIGNMLANLTDELDAMLEEEKRLDAQ